MLRVLIVGQKNIITTLTHNVNVNIHDIWGIHESLPFLRIFFLCCTSSLARLHVTRKRETKYCHLTSHSFATQAERERESELGIRENMYWMENYTGLYMLLGVVAHSSLEKCNNETGWMAEWNRLKHFKNPLPLHLLTWRAHTAISLTWKLYWKFPNAIIPFSCSTLWRRSLCVSRVGSVREMRRANIIYNFEICHSNPQKNI